MDEKTSCPSLFWEKIMKPNRFFNLAFVVLLFAVCVVSSFAQQQMNAQQKELAAYIKENYPK
jgi:hypothetical protein